MTLSQVLRRVAVAVALATIVPVAACSGDTQDSPVPDAPTSRQSQSPVPSAPETSSAPSARTVEEPWEILRPDLDATLEPVIVPVEGDSDITFECGPAYVSYVLTDDDPKIVLSDGNGFDQTIELVWDDGDVHVKISPKNTRIVGGVVNGHVPFLLPSKSDGNLVGDFYVDTEMSGVVEGEFWGFTLCAPNDEDDQQA